MVRSQCPLASIQRLPVKGLCLGVLSSIVKQVGEIVHRGETVDVFRAKHLLSLRQAFSKEFFCGGILSPLEVPAPVPPSPEGLVEPGPVLALRRFSPNHNDEHDAQNDPKYQQTSAQKAPRRLIGGLRWTGGLLRKIDRQNLTGIGHHHRARTSLYALETEGSGVTLACRRLHLTLYRAD